ncbi:MAG TPA: DUF3108 domain-containing protein [Alphaproteobacteria bacterium]|nr:DUF3108 domain-containing protein [Alphaproteobacteria bacterium]HRK98543.1 DUF3108 domain-containing protein [Alphaproteobacteria bacterium]
MKRLPTALYVFILTFMFWNSPSSAQTQTMTYDVYAGGIHALDAKLIIKTSEKDYDITLSSATHGFLKTLAPWSGIFSTSGQISKDNKPNPLEHLSISTWKSSTEEKKYTYDGKGKFLDYTVTESKKDKEPVDKTPEKIEEGLTKDSTDLLSATLELLMTLPATQTCAGNSIIFDGDRSFKLLFTETTRSPLKKSKYNIFEGDSLSCQVEVSPDKGKWRKKPRGWLSIQEQGRKKGALPTIWLGLMPEPNPNQSPYIPVKIRVKTDYGTLFMHLTSYKNDEEDPQKKP